MNQADFERLEREFIRIRDERGVHANTAVRIGTAFLDLLRMSLNGEFDEISFNKVLNKPTFLQGLITLGSIIFGEYAEGLQGGIITEEGVAELKDLWVREHAKLGDGTKHYDEAGRVIPALEVKGDSTFSGNLSSPEFVSAFFGGLGWAIQKKEVVNAAGEKEYKYHLEIDDITIRNTLRVFEMIISQLLGENANRYFSDMMEVDHYDLDTGRVYLNTDGGRLYNPFREGDIIRVQQYNNDPSEDNDWYVTKAYELRITAAGLGNRDDGEDRLDWVEFDNFSTTMENGSAESLIAKRDTFVRWDNDRDPKRKGLVSIMAIGENTPYMDILYGQKTDPEHALKGRFGNLEGVRTDLFGWLEGFGAYINNLYGVGKFFNYQTGESLTASMQMTRELFKRVYTETTYNISDEDNFLQNGFFQHDLEGWVKCNVDGSAAAEEDDTQVLGNDNGGGTLPLMVNGTPISVSSKTTVKVEDMDGIRVLHIQGMGISQDFSLIRKNGTHEEMASTVSSVTNTVEVPDALFMGIRILPVTAGRLRVIFKKAAGGYSGWERDIDNDINWQLIQAADNSDAPWNWEGQGRLIVSYTGECYIRFVALMTDPVVNVKEQYRTKIEQTSRIINFQASKQSNDLQDAVADFNLKYDQISQTVTNNYNLFSGNISDINGDITALGNRITSAQEILQENIEDLDRSVRAYNAENDGLWAGYATWKSQTDTSVASFATALTVDGRIGSLSSVIQSYNSIAGRVSSVETISSQNSTDINNISDRTGTLEDGLSSANSNITSIAERVGQLEITDSSITGRVSSVETTIDSHSNSISSLNSDVSDHGNAISSINSELSGIERDISSMSSRISTVEITSSSITNRVSAIESRPLDICNLDFWESGSTNERTGYTYEQIKVASNTRIRTKGLYPVTEATACFMSTYGRNNYNIGLVYFTSEKVVCSTTWKGWETLPYDTKKISIDPPSDCAYVAVLLKRRDDGEISVSEVKNTGITITSDNLVTSAEISTFISDKDGTLISHAKIKADRIDFQTDGWTVTNNDGVTTLSLDSGGNLYIRGNINGGNITDEVCIGSGSNKMYIRPNQSNGAELVGISDDTEVVRLGFDNYTGYLKMASRNGLNYTEIINREYGGAQRNGLTITTASNTRIYIGMSGNKFIIRGTTTDSTPQGRTDIWLTNNNANVGDVYLDTSTGNLKVKMS